MGAEKVVNVYRNGRLESSHMGHIAVVNAKGELLYEVGDVNRRTYARSSVKPIQAIPLVETGAADFFNYSEADLSIACASHSGEEQHTSRVADILQRSGINEDRLQCGPHIPHSQDTYKQLIANGGELTSVHSNCSGKHTGMLVTAKYMDEPLEDYHEAGHPVQQRIKEVLSDLTEYPEADIGVGIDGCGVPVFELPLERLALGFARLADPSGLSEGRRDAIERVTSAMMKYPEMVGGTGRFCTDFMKVADGRLFGKAGAESVYCIGDRETGIGIAIKVEDGSGRAMYPVALEVLKQLGLLSGSQLVELEDHYKPKIKNTRQEKVGEIVASFKLKSASPL
ncbi:asparaginase [Pseudalkalibacillus caeni]|uniref:Asparaginase n=1 Tax=Exobacillus caeni TaxID=2574798 RepID=A0A5R9F4J7_9BACL|nr:asparaginase [Pseudalkalibacillus caeni]TLS38622.1 asparaginase [Pseudalkalibacillus caeni]